MAKAPEKITRLKKPSSSPFSFCCFGVSSPEEKVSSNRRGKKTRGGGGGLFSWSMFRMKKSAAKTVPLDTSTDLSETKIHSPKSSSKWKIQKLFTKGGSGTTKAMPFREVPTLSKEIIEETTQELEQENRKSFSPAADTPKDATCRKRLSFRRKIDNIRTGSTQPGLPDVDVKPNPNPNPKTGRTKTAAILSHSVSMPVPARETRGNQQLSKARVVPKRTRQDDEVTMVNKFDPVVGMSIIVVTLIIMLIWGRFCAILCTSAWLYFVPRLRALKNDKIDAAALKINGDLDLNSEEYKRRVVLEGFLDRNHRAVTAVL